MKQVTDARKKKANSRILGTVLKLAHMIEKFESVQPALMSHLFVSRRRHQKDPIFFALAKKYEKHKILLQVLA